MILYVSFDNIWFPVFPEIRYLMGRHNHCWKVKTLFLDISTRPRSGMHEREQLSDRHLANWLWGPRPSALQQRDSCLMSHTKLLDHFLNLNPRRCDRNELTSTVLSTESCPWTPGWFVIDTRYSWCRSPRLWTIRPMTIPSCRMPPYCLDQ